MGLAREPGWFLKILIASDPLHGVLYCTILYCTVQKDKKDKNTEIQKDKITPTRQVA